MITYLLTMNIDDFSFSLARLYFLIFYLISIDRNTIIATSKKKKKLKLLKSCLQAMKKSGYSGQGIFSDYIFFILTSLMAHMVKHLPTMWETWVQSLG